MSARSVWIALGVALLIAGAVGLAIYGGGSSRPPSPLEGIEAPSFVMPVVAGEGAGERVDLTALRGEVVALDFWASWCGPCRRSIPVLNRLHERYGSRIHLYGVSIEAHLSAARIQAAHRSFGAGFPSLLDEGLRAQGAYNVQSIPTLVLIDRRGTIRHLSTGVPDEDEIAEVLDELLAEPR